MFPAFYHLSLFFFFYFDGCFVPYLCRFLLSAKSSVLPLLHQTLRFLIFPEKLLNLQSGQQLMVSWSCNIPYLSFMYSVTSFKLLLSKNVFGSISVTIILQLRVSSTRSMFFVLIECSWYPSFFLFVFQLLNQIFYVELFVVEMLPLVLFLYTRQAHNIHVIWLFCITAIAKFAAFGRVALQSSCCS